MPNPWIALPALLLGVLAGVLGWVVTDVSCRETDAAGEVTTCGGWVVLVAALAFLAVTVSVMLVLSLVYRSLAEWREKGQQDDHRT